MVTKFCGFSPVYLVMFDCLQTSSKLSVLLSGPSVVARCLCIEGARMACLCQVGSMDERSKPRLKQVGKG